MDMNAEKTRPEPDPISLGTTSPSDTSPPQPKRNVLVVSLAQYTRGVSANEIIQTELQRGSRLDIAASFKYIGFDVNPDDEKDTLARLRKLLRLKWPVLCDENIDRWHGVLLGWNFRREKELTPLFQKVMQICVDEAGEKRDLRLIFCMGEGDLLEATARGFMMG